MGLRTDAETYVALFEEYQRLRRENHSLRKENKLVWVLVFTTFIVMMVTWPS